MNYMSNFYLIGDIGNTEVKICFYKNKKIIKKIRIKSDKINNSTLDNKLSSLKKYKNNIKQILFSSVVPNVYKIINRYFKLIFQFKCYELKNLKLKKLLNINVNERQIGSDRLANAISIIDNKNNYIIVDFGTATNFDVVVNNSYIGGVIAPGINLSLENLSSKASLIPKIKFSKSKNIIGKSTVTAVNSGYFFGYIGLIDNIIQSIIKQTKKKYLIIFTGGYSNMFYKSFKFKVRVKPNLTIEGVLKAAYSLN